MTSGMPAEKRKRSKAMCVALPMPASVHTILPGFAFAAETKSLMVLYFSGCATSAVGIVATVATGCSSLVFSTSGCSSGDTVKADAYIMMRWPSGSDWATYFAPTSPPAPSRFSTITGWPHFCCSFSARMRAMVSEALPGVTPETNLTVLVGNCWAFALPRNNAQIKIATSVLTVILLVFWQAELLRQPVRGLAAITIGAVVGIVAAVLHDHELHRARDAL